ncbi:AfsR/SARP family transcriptional regulator [Nocardioides jensenii]|uniref:AfsR/SARP family transcriptional regulator n=1 Tax=Nocardioides jensenii TaxID=1843 RepID=UPI00082D4EA2|nr:BTAD domain-containing putative transcriptional regulator [Nocardioides jensenii]
MSQIDIRMFGRVRVLRDGVDLALPGRRLRALLALLALSPGRAVSAETLGRGIWGDPPPQRLSGSLHTCVARLRSVVGHDLITTGSSGYTLQVPRDAVDVLRFLDALDPVAGEGSTHEEHRLRQALGLWVAEPFGEQLSDWIERHELPRLVEQRLLALERLVDLDLATGRQARWLGELRALVEQHPLRESLWLLQLRALHGSGRRAEALERYDDLRQLLSEELGTDPSAELQQMHQVLLREPLQSQEYDDASTGGGPTPRQLPMQVARFIGRVAETAALDTLLAARTTPVEPTEVLDVAPPGIAAVTGPGGVGKTSLVLNWARRNESRFPDGQLFVNLGGNGAGPPLTHAEALAELLRGLGVAGHRVPEGIADRSALLRTETTERRVLLVLDDARDSAQLRPLLPGNGATVVITSRSQLRGLTAREGVPRLMLGAMSDQEAVALLRSRFGREAETADLTELAGLCGHLPLALAVAAERAGRDHAYAVTQLNEQLRDERSRLDLLSAGEETSIRAVHDWSYKQLDEPAARMFRLLGLQRCGFVSAPGAAALAGVDEREAAGLLDRLTDSSLLSVGWPGWHQIHDLTRLYALSRLEEATAAREKVDGVERLQSWYVHSARNARDALQPARINLELRDPAPGMTPQEFETPRAAYEWLSAHHRSLSVLIADAVESGAHRLVAELAPSLCERLTLLRDNAGQIAVCRTHVRAAELDGDPRMIGLAEAQLGGALNRSGRLDEAHGAYERAHAQMVRADDLEGEIFALSRIGMNLVTSTRMAEGISLLETALDMRVRDGDGERDTATLNNLAWAHAMEGRLDVAIRYAEEAVAGYRRHGNLLGEANGLDTLAMVQAFRGAFPEASKTLVEAIDIHRSLGNVQGEVLLLTTLGTVQRDAGWHRDALETWGSALRVIDGAPGWMNFDPAPVIALLDDLGRTPIVPAQRVSGQVWPTSIR